MATVMDRHHSHHVTTPRTALQKVCIGMGILFVLGGLGGIIMPGMLGLHLSVAHNLIHLVSGGLALWVGYADDSRKAYNYAVGFGVVYGLLALAGFIFGEPGYPGVGHMEADENLLRVIPNVLEFGTADHTLHILITAVLLASAYAYKKRRDTTGRSNTFSDANRMGRTTTSSDVFRTQSEDLSNFDRDLKDASLGREDINRRSDINRRTDFESRI